MWLQCFQFSFGRGVFTLHWMICVITSMHTFKMHCDITFLDMRQAVATHGTHTITVHHWQDELYQSDFFRDGYITVLMCALNYGELSTGKLIIRTHKRVTSIQRNWSPPKAYRFNAAYQKHSVAGDFIMLPDQLERSGTTEYSPL
jgi:hypothetical protein